MASVAQAVTTGQENWNIGNIFLPSVNKHLKKLGIETLKDVKMIEESKEIRFWVGFSYNGFTGLILKGQANEWSATYIPASNSATSSPAPRRLPSPRNGWDKLLSEIEALGAYTLPGEPDPLPERLGIKDGLAAVVEIKTPALYRAYLYAGLHYYEEQDVKKMEKIINLLSEEFKVNLY